MDHQLQQIVDLASQVDLHLSSLQQQVNVDALDEAQEQPVLVFDGLELTPWLLAEGALADSDTSSGNIPVAIQRQPLVECASLAIDPRGKSYANAYWYKKLGADPSRASFVYEASFLFPTSLNASASQAVEFDLQQVINGKVYNWGWQFNYAGGNFRIWNRSAKFWTPSLTVLERPSTLTWITAKFTGHRSDNLIYYDSIQLGTQSYQPGASFPAPQLGLTDMLNCAVQLDGNSSGASYRVMVDRIRLTAS